MPTSPVLVFTTSEGHKSIGESVVHFLQQNDIASELVFIEEPGLKYYKLIYQYSPSSFRYFYKFSHTFLANFFLKRVLLSEHEESVKKILDVKKAHLIISTSLGFTPAIAKYKQTHPEIHFINILPNPRTFFKQDIADQANVQCVFDQQTVQDIKSIKETNVITTGWFVRPQFEGKYDKTQVRKSLGLKDNLLTILCVSGSEGTKDILDTALSLKDFANVQIIVACGNNKTLLKQLKTLSDTTSKNITALPFTNQLHRYMQAADLVVGKAGPNMVFEAIATNTPFFATTHIGGLEDGNIQIIQEYDIGFVEEDKKRAIHVLQTLLASPDRIEQKRKNVEKLASYLQKEKHNLIKYIHENVPV